jgi:hypothetical protein
MALHSEWVSGSLRFYDSATTDSILIVSKSGLGVIARQYYAGSTSNIGLSTTMTGPVLTMTVENGIVISATS